MRIVTKMLMSCLWITSLLSATDYRWVRFDFPGATEIYGLGINARGDIVGRYVDTAGVTHGFLMQQGSFTTIDFPQATFTAARGVNARGDIVGRFLDAGGNEHGFLLEDGRYKRIDYPGAAATTARGINNSGEISGRHSDAAGNENGFVLKDGTFHNVRVPNPLTPLEPCSTDVWLVQDNERVVIGDFCTNLDGGIHGFIRMRPGVFQMIDFPGAGAPCSAMRWINERGDRVGVYAKTLGECFAFQAHGFLIREGQFTALDFPASLYTETFGINDDGVIVGDYTDRTNVHHAFKAMPTSSHE
jgi:probable HAF family extracellular repeat protein